MNSFWLVCRDSISIKCHIHRYWGLGLQYLLRGYISTYNRVRKRGVWSQMVPREIVTVEASNSQRSRPIEECVMNKERFPGGSRGKGSAFQCRRRRFDLWVGKIPWRREWLPTPLFLPGEFHGQRSLVGLSPWGGKESDTTEQTRNK